MPIGTRTAGRGHAAEHAYDLHAVGHGVAGGQGVGAAARKADHPELLEAQLVDEDLEVGDVVEDGVGEVRGGQARARTVDAHEADADLFGGEAGRFRDLTAGARSAVKPEDGPASGRAELGEAKRAIVPDGDPALDAGRGDDRHIALFHR
jgi:hypothetical protein